MRRLSKRSREIYFIDDTIETIRCNEVHDYAMHVQMNQADPSTMGETVSRFQSLDQSIDSLIAAAIERAKLIINPRFNFAQTRALGQNRITDLSLKTLSLAELTEITRSIHHDCKKSLPQFRLNSSEFFFEEYEVDMVNCFGVENHATSTRVVFDYVLTSPNGKHEMMGLKKRRYLKDMHFLAQLEADAAALRDIENAVLPPTGVFPVILADEAMDSLFTFFTGQLDAHALFNQYSVYEKGKPAILDPLEPMTLISDPTIEGLMHSYAFDDLGYPTKPVALIEENRVKNFCINGQYADLLKMESTSSFTNVVVRPGKTSYRDFISDGVIEVLKFSTFQPNGISGAFSGEIRLGYLHRNGKKIPIKGGSVSGQTQTAFARAHYAVELTERAAYRGPQGVFFEALTIAGS